MTKERLELLKIHLILLKGQEREAAWIVSEANSLSRVINKKVVISGTQVNQKL